MLDSAISFLSEKLLEIVPELVTIDPYRDKNLNRWRETGAYNTLSGSKNELVLAVNQREYAGVIFSECHHLLNQASENRAHFISVVENDDDPSPSWCFVTFYYFSLYLMLALGRVCNQAIAYLDKEAIDTFSQTELIKPGAGSFLFQFRMRQDAVPVVSISKASSNHFHDAAWIAVVKQMRELKILLEARTKDRQATEEEQLSLGVADLFLGLSFKESQTWPSRLRNAINYRTGFSYRSVTKNNFLKKYLGIKGPSFDDINSVILHAQSAKRALEGLRHPSEEPLRAIELMVCQSLLIEVLLENALDMVTDERGIKCSSKGERTKFNRKYSDKTILRPLGRLG